MLYNKSSILGNSFAAIQGFSFVNATGMIVALATHRLGTGFYVDSAITVNSIDVFLNIIGTTTGITLTLQIETDSGNAPSGTVVGAATSAFACPTVAGATGQKTLGTPAVLTPGTKYWITTTDGGGTAPTASNGYQTKDSGFNNASWMGGSLRQFNGTNWTTTALVTADGLFILQDSTGAFHGQMTTANITISARTAVFGTNYSGIVMKFAVPTLVYGVRAQIRLIGVPPGALECVMTKDGGTAISVSNSVASGSFITSTPVMFVFNNGVPILVPANVNIYFLLHQVGGTGTSATAYNQNVSFPNSTYISAMANSDYREVAGTLASNNADPSGLTRFTNELPEIGPLIINSSTDFSGSSTTGFFIQ